MSPIFNERMGGGGVVEGKDKWNNTFPPDWRKKGGRTSL